MLHHLSKQPKNHFYFLFIQRKIGLADIDIFVFNDNHHRIKKQSPEEKIKIQ